MKYYALLFVLILASHSAIQAQNLTHDGGVKKHSGIDSIYKDFSEAYRTLKPELVSSLYTKDAAYLVPGNDIMTGRENILANFSGFFKSIRESGRSMTISFHINQRMVDKKLGYDVGIYTLRYYKDGKMQGESKGKFVVVSVKGKDKKWRFQVDGYSDIKPSQRN